ncbi:acyl-CoA dehydrogenase family protein, partial [Candidatus Binatus sp.]|uniref:acyl-CoA dehydrogenase family protein n=1 Tax=Candidatus Binatus sp. TaxID=2811406 RepID=UPI003C5689CE
MIDFELSEEQQMIRDSVGSFAREKIRPAARPADESGAIPAALVAEAWQFGFVSGAIPEKFGGGGDIRSAVTGAIVAEELGFGDISIALHVLAPRLFAFPIVEMGTDEQQAKYLKRFAGADFAAATAAVMEPRFDFDLSAQQVSAKRDGAGYILNGGKCYVPLAAESESILIYAATDASKGYAGVDGFIVPRNAAGVTISDREKNMGLKPLATYELTLK